jgi:hypothetical protein
MSYTSRFLTGHLDRGTCRQPVGNQSATSLDQHTTADSVDVKVLSRPELVFCKVLTSSAFAISAVQMRLRDRKRDNPLSGSASSTRWSLFTSVKDWEGCCGYDNFSNDTEHGHASDSDRDS